MYAAGIFVVFFVAVGVGAAAVVVGGWLLEPGVPGFQSIPESSTFEDSVMETTSSSENSNPKGPANRASFIHRATDENSRGDFTYISDPSIDGNPDAVVLVEQTSDRGSAKDTTYKHNIGVWYALPYKKKWAIFNQDRAAVPAGSTFRVVVPPAAGSFVHHAGPINTVGNTTYLGHQLTNDNPDVELSVTQNWNPGGGRGVYNNHPIDVLYDKDADKWAIFNRDDAPMPDGAAFNIAVSRDGPAR